MRIELSSADFSQNRYRAADPAAFDALVEVVTLHPRHYSQMLAGRMNDVGKWVDRVTPALSAAGYGTGTKCHWILAGLTDFPTCPVCGGKDGFRGKNVKVFDGYREYCSSRCANLDPDVDGRKRRTCEERYGTAHPMQSPDVKARYRATCLERMGVDNSLKSPLCLQKRNSTWEARYGQACPNKCAAVQEKRRRTCMERYGVENVGQLESVREKAVATTMNRYGCANPMQDCNIRRRAEDTLEANYGVRHPSLSPDIVRRSRSRYFHDGRYFDSGPEVALYVWLVDSGLPFRYRPDIRFEYWHAGKKHLYFPDFVVCGVPVEIKGRHFVSADGTWRNPFRRKDWSDRQYAESCALYDAKRKCCADNGVVVLFTRDYLPFVKYVRGKYGENWLKSLKTPHVRRI